MRQKPSSLKKKRRNFQRQDNIVLDEAGYFETSLLDPDNSFFLKPLKKPLWRKKGPFKMFIYGNLTMVGFEPRNNLLLITYAATTLKITQ